MANLKYEGREAQSREGETVLDAFLRQGITVPFSCRSGACHVCMQRCVSGTVPPVAQHGLRQELRDKNYFLTCKCVPMGDMEIAPPTDIYHSTILHTREMLSPWVCRLLIEPPSGLNYRAGQFINLRRPDGTTRSYSLASIPEEDYFIELHVQRKDGGIMSNWLLDELQPGDEIEIQGPDGDCYFREELRGSPLLLVGTGTGLAPLWGIVRDALRNQHQAEIHLYHGGRDEDRFYLRKGLRELEAQHPNFHYHECLSSWGGRPLPEGAHEGRVHEVAFASHPNLHGWHVILAGLAEMVVEGEQLAVKQGASAHDIHSDAYTLRDLRQGPRGKKAAAPEPEAPAAKPKYPPPDPELWAALGEGELLHQILADFYGKVYQDDRLAKFFDGVTKQRLIEKQFLFMRQILTGEKIYFGDQPRNLHHWMVISEDLFDYRINMMLDSLRKCGLSEEMVQRFHAIEEYYREDLIKDKPFPKKIGDLEMPLEGFNELVLDVGALCDACQREVNPGEKVIYHVRLGKIYCSDCSTPHEHEVPAE